MKLEAAAAVLGVAVDADPETLKAAYRRLALRWHPDKCKEADAKERFQEVSVAYTRLVSGESGRDHDGDGSERFYDDVDEMRAFMSMFMELVGMFGSDIPSMPNGCGPGCKGGHVQMPPGMPPDMADMPSASVAFSMMFGERPQEETWSSEEEDGEGREEDYDHDEEEFDLDEAAAAAEAFKAGAAGAGGPAAAGGECLWEPMVRHYFHMNLKEEVEQQRAAGLGGASGGTSEAVQLEDEALRQARALKKRQDKKRRQREKKQQQRASAAKEAADQRDAQQDEGKKDEDTSVADKRKEVVRLKRKAEEERRVGLFTACRAGFVEEVRLMLGTGLIRCTERERENGSSGASLLHSCVTDFAGSPDNAPQLKELAIDRLSIAAMILASTDPAVDAGWVDSVGLTVLHRVAEALDLPYLALLLEERQKSQERRDQILLDERCLLKGWTPLHYAAAEGSPVGVSTLLTAGASVSVRGAVLDGIEPSSSNGAGGGGGAGGGDGGTALQLARALLSKEGAGPRKKGLQEVARQLSAATQAVERAKEQRERKEREAKLAKKRSEVQKEKKKEARERELLSRKQRQLKDKQERLEREERQEEERKGRKEDQGKAEEGKTKKGKKAKKKKNSNNKTGDEDSVADRGLAANGGAEGAPTGKDTGDGAPVAVVAAASSSRPRAAAAAAARAGNASPAAPAVSESAHESSMSRDDLLAQLIAMGFQEEHVHRGTSCVGFDLNALLSWLFEHPDGGVTPAEQASAAASKASAANARRKGPASKAKATKVDAGKGNSGVISSALRNHGHGALAGIAVSGGVGGPGGAGWGGAGVVPGSGKDGGGGGGVGVGGGPATVAAAAAKAEEKRRHNLELRRINRAWNASLPLRRAEEEEKKAAETAREKEIEDAKDEKRKLMESQSLSGRVVRSSTIFCLRDHQNRLDGVARTELVLGRGGGGDGSSPGAADAAHQTHAAGGGAAAAAERVPAPRRGGGSGTEQQGSASLAEPAAAWQGGACQREADAAGLATGG
ncbi:Heat shock protein 40 like protein/ DnaJ domain containing protein [Ectocarpus siliculosus]|uniref:Heat shock protein 40 like protein/ DnaJ domain containing protein n=1 Tax=Ectocarpus siliculosus TaxID=2880 RepID=D8LMX5_ECTSI|nr:Heat shock protein 40 like protein/ DnaJ domain containing protein [Ectocarpus siliculosus]|eukprot:CBN74776.1 Heat shock protein 40 like protein/ DnaJ domain containing protein [Ectocarpus siliculosus]